MGFINYLEILVYPKSFLYNGGTQWKSGPPFEFACFLFLLSQQL